MAPFGTLASPQMLLLGTGYSSLGPPSPIGIFLTEQQILTWKLVSDLVSTHLPDDTEVVLGPSWNVWGLVFFVVLPILKASNLAGSIGTFSADSMRDGV